MLTEKQIKQLHLLGIEEDQIETQITFFTEGFNFSNLVKPAVIEDGIFHASDEEIESWSKKYDEFSLNSRIVKFVPASGAATRMFKGLYEFLENPQKSSDADILLKNIEKFAFYEDLRDAFKIKSIDIHDVMNQKGLSIIIKELLEKEGLNYGNLPKGLIKFHHYPNETRTSVEEHIAEGIKYAVSKDTLRLHFTISPEHEKLFSNEFNKLKNKYLAQTKFNIDITSSYQKKSTDTIAVDMDNCPLVDHEGKLIFRPGGHGALLENLNEIEADIIFIKNVDNLVPDYLKPITVKYKKAIAGLLVLLKQQIAEYLTYLEWHDIYTEKHKREIAAFMEKYLGIKIPEGIDNSVFAGYVKSKLDKPIRVCGMVKNVGEAGGGPFWTLNRNGEPTLQIIESSQVDMNDSSQKKIFTEATHFNPVDLVCYTKDYTGNKFNLLKYRDSSAGFISEKTISGKKIKAQELPGLWNGGMAHWITLFVEVPLETFNPVKSFADLLRKEHQPK